PRFRGDHRRPHHQGQAPLLLLPGMEPREARAHALRLRAHGRGAGRGLQRADHRRLLLAHARRSHDGPGLRRQQDPAEPPEPRGEETLWGDDPFPAVDSNWDQPGRSLTAQLTKNIGAKGVNSLTFTYSANVITVTRGGTNPGLNSQIVSAVPDLFPDSIKEYG